MTDQKQTVLLVEDDEPLRLATAQSLELAGMAVSAHADAAAALAALDAGFAGAVVSDLRMPRMDGLQLFARIREIDPEIPVILITGHADVPTAVTALREGAFDFLPKPFATDHLVASVAKALDTRRLVLDNRMLRAPGDTGPSPLIGAAPAIQRLREMVAQLARTDIDVLVEGETGTGKELVALLLHRTGSRRGRPFVAVNCGCLLDASAEADLFGQLGHVVGHGRLDRVGRIEAAHGGTLFLDEIDSMPLTLQAALLRVIEEREVVPIGAATPRPLDLRVVAASKRDLRELVVEGRFRADLLYRLSVIRLHIPPLRDRREDIPLLFSHFVQEAIARTRTERFRLDERGQRHLADHDWLGNVRELRNFAFSTVLGISSFGDGDGGAERRLTLAERVDRFEAVLIREALTATQGDVRDTMAMLSVPRKTLYDKMNRHGIDIALFRAVGSG